MAAQTPPRTRQRPSPPRPAPASDFHAARPSPDEIATMVNAIPFLWLKGWHAPAGRRACGPRPLAQDGQIGTAPPVGAITWDPADESFERQPERASADSEVRPGPRVSAKSE